MAILTRTINSSNTEIYVNGGGDYITEAAPTNFHTFARQRILLEGQTVDDFREVTEAQKTSISAADAKWTAPSEEFVAHMASLGVSYNADTGFFECGDVYDLTEADAREIDRVLLYSRNGENASYLYGAEFHIRAMPQMPPYAGGGALDAHGAFQSCFILEWVDFGDWWKLKHMSSLFSNCKKLRTVRGLRMAPNCVTPKYTFENCLALVNLELLGLCQSVTLEHSPLLSLASLTYMVNNAANTSAITITLHPDAYGRITEELFEAAAAKNITFATTS